MDKNIIQENETTKNDIDIIENKNNVISKIEDEIESESESESNNQDKNEEKNEIIDKENIIIIELFKTIDLFINQIKLSFDYIKNLSEIDKYIEQIKNNNDIFDIFINDTYLHLKNYENELIFIISENKKNSKHYIFLNNIKLFDNKLIFNIFNNENKNTKKSLIKYIYNIFLNCSFLKLTKNGLVNNDLDAFISNIKEIAKQIPKETSNKKQESNDNTEIVKQIPKETRNKKQESNDNTEILSTIFENKALLSIATDLTDKLKKDNVNPMMMINDILSGNIQNSPLNGMINDIQSSIEDKINKKEINTKELQLQASKMVTMIGTSNLRNLGILGNLDNLDKLFKNKF